MLTMGAGWHSLTRAVDREVTRAFEWLVAHVGERLGCAVPFLSTALFGSILPLTLHWVPGWYGLLALVIFATCAFVGFAYVVRLHRESKSRNLLDWTTDMRRLDSDEFEWFTCELFRREGYEPVKVGSAHRGDGNIDIVLRRGSENVLVQCKRWTARYVGPGVVREFAGTFPAKGGVTERVLLTLSDFTDDAKVAAGRAGVTLVDGAELAIRLQKVRRTEPCSECGTPMLLDRSPRGWWLRCPRFSAGCLGKRDLSRDPGRAVDLLLEQPSS
jgi:HJR/Mrr/RecB family endonuclease